MKNLFLSMLVIFLVVGCSSDGDGVAVEVDKNIAAEATISKQSGPANAANPFDAIGKRYGIWLSEYYQSKGYPKGIDELRALVNYSGAKWKAPNFAGKSSIVITAEDISVIVSNPEASVASAFAMGTLGDEAKTSLLGLFLWLIQEKEAEYKLLYDFIVAYEAGVIDSSTLTRQEVETILGITSVTRYALDAEGEHKDRDWEISVGNKKVKSGVYPFRASLISVIAHLPYYL
ncbi:hypothetical protein [Flavobacterium granuli]|uniref:Uncharacterized protein n=1 Tax=Flavobacterium granuli TaxID=280093 RepID=A0A1M5RQT1_9FLAO|nr:hypothetical protein [Flavobacterium granuli]PRZ22786.1 hypothetical protein BC624_10634 [Flavobacterium granuli]SHH28549.1 hypothetical protein SAMN05443373_11088 [Flavobacterium granuli]